MWQMWKTTHLLLVLRQMDAQSQSDDHGADREIPCWCPSTVVLYNSIYYQSTQRLQLHLVTVEAYFSQNLLFQKIPCLELCGIHFEKGKPRSCDHMITPWEEECRLKPAK